MPNLFPFFSWSWLSAMLGPLSWAVGILLIAYDLTRMYLESRQKQRPATWYERPLLWLGGGGITIGLVIWAEMLIASLPDIWAWSILLLGFFVIGILMLICTALTLALSRNKPEALSREAGVASRTSSKYSFIRENPLLTTTRISLFGCATMCFMVIWGIWGLPFRLVPNQLFFDGVWFVLGLLAVWCIHGTLAYMRLLKQIEQLRIELAEKTSPEASALERVFPFQEPTHPLVPPILLRHTWGFMVIWLACGLALGQMFVQPLLTSPQIQVLLLFKLSIILLVAGLVFFFGLRVRYKVEVTQSGLTSVCGIQTKNISWRQARLFVCYKVPGFFFGRKTTMIYELSGPSQVVQWTRVFEARSLFAVWKPVLPMDEYQRQVLELCQLITAKTGLPLHDLSEIEPMEIPAFGNVNSFGVNDPQTKAFQRFGL